MPVIHIIEDDRDLLQLLAFYFTSEGFDVFDDYNGDKFAAGMVSNADIYLVDITLVNKNGMDLSNQIKNGKIVKPVILMSANFHLNQVAPASSADDFIRKPFELDDMIERVKKIISQSAS